jgi:hypothetical protein
MFKTQRFGKCFFPLSKLTELGLERIVASVMLPCMALVRTDVSEELSASFSSVTRIDELGTTLAVTSNRHTLIGIYSQRTSVASYR